MLKLIIASKNPVKINAAKSGFVKMFPGEEFETEIISVSSGVKDQPTSDGEALQGARNRAINSQKERPDADFWIGMEGGIEEKDYGVEVFGWAVVLGRDGKIGNGKTGSFLLPDKIARLVKDGKELGEADDIVFGRTNSKQENGAVGILTGNIIDRTKYLEEAVIYALVPFKNKELY